MIGDVSNSSSGQQWLFRLARLFDILAGSSRGGRPKSLLGLFEVFGTETERVDIAAVALQGRNLRLAPCIKN